MKQTKSVALLLALCIGFVLGLGYSHITKPLEPVPGQHKLDAEPVKERTHENNCI